ncbi:MAPEG family protein [Litoreibacter ponti]|uniref:MAPEG family protein n=1 Tax=Litoreibacter ponti TaxID=1510457 RepID=A0A2T6BJX3_9RHOB|nr:MAPEG family protein [Litoreibacter ponti]PTX56356.1 MAPEG family protein [Litoreibacter ponti]
MTFETALIGFALVTMTALTIEIVYAYVTQGFGYGFSSNRPIVEKSALGLRIQRAYQNQVESAAYIVPVLVGSAMLGISGDGPALAAAIIVFGRAAFVLLYYTGIPFIRILGFTCGSLGSLYLAVSCLLAVTG